MKFLRQNILSMIAVAVFAIGAAVVEGSFVFDYGNYSDTVQVSDGVNHNLLANDFAGEPLFLSRETTSEAVLLTRRPGQQALSRTLRSGNFHGFSGRDSGFFKRATAPAGIHGTPRTTTPNGFPTPLAYQAPKDYYVFTLKRILC
jgi:hypothetical protein